ncbi:MAG: site-2 protease family protein [Chloroflexota bacterium]|jgi:Zn-dependent protease|nr:site-2 protease family protein [Chloroflexota bacterium]
MNFSLRSIDEVLAILLSFVIATSIHEFMHAAVALRLGDTTARDQGRITLNPMSHFEPFGFFGMVMISLGIPFIGWGKPVPVSTWRMNRIAREHRRRGLALVAFAGPLSNVAQAALAAVPIQIAARTGTELGNIGFALGWFITVNILLASFNMIPIPPLDGFNILNGVLPSFWEPVLSPLARYGFPILLLLFFLPGGFGNTIVSSLLSPVQSSLSELLYFGLA